MALTDVEKVRLLIGDVTSSPFYPLFSDTEIEAFIEMTGSVQQASLQAAISAAMVVAGMPTRERVGDGELEIANNMANAYVKALEKFITQSNKTSLTGIMPWVSNVEVEEMKSYAADTTLNKPSIFVLKCLPT